MLTTALAFSLAAATIVIAGVFLTKFADAIADITGWGRLLAGSILLAGATSLPELAVDLSAVHIQQPNLAVGDLLGSCLCNLAADGGPRRHPGTRSGGADAGPPRNESPQGDRRLRRGRPGHPPRRPLPRARRGRTRRSQRARKDVRRNDSRRTQHLPA